MKKYILPFFMILSLLTVSYTVYAPIENAEVLSKQGSRGDEVRKIQTNLKKWRYYDGNIDGIYGPITTRAVKYFQQKNNLRVDGIAGPETLRALGIVSTSGNGGNAQSSGDINLLARCVYGEARGEPYEGQVAVAAVVLNRVKHPSFPHTIAGVIYQPGAFTAVADGQINAGIDETAQRAARDAMNGWDPSNGCIYYYNPAKTTNQWIYSRQVMLVIGKHRFAK